MRVKKRIIRALIEEVIVDVEGTVPESIITIHWKGGVHSQLRLARRLAAAREDAAALHVLDAVAAAGQAPAGAVESCLTNLYRAYARQGQDALAEEIRRRLAASGQTAERCITSR